jgi:hypothetical protein
MWVRFTVPLCRGDHREVHHCGDEGAWWAKVGTDPTVAARALWLEIHQLAPAADKMREVGSIAAAASNRRSRKSDRPVGKRGPDYETNPIASISQT